MVVFFILALMCFGGRHCNRNSLHRSERRESMATLQETTPAAAGRVKVELKVQSPLAGMPGIRPQLEQLANAVARSLTGAYLQILRKQAPQGSEPLIHECRRSEGFGDVVLTLTFYVHPDDKAGLLTRLESEVVFETLVIPQLRAFAAPVSAAPALAAV